LGANAKALARYPMPGGAHAIYQNSLCGDNFGAALYLGPIGSGIFIQLWLGWIEALQFWAAKQSEEPSL